MLCSWRLYFLGRESNKHAFLFSVTCHTLGSAILWASSQGAASQRGELHSIQEYVQRLVESVPCGNGVLIGTTLRTPLISGVRNSGTHCFHVLAWFHLVPLVVRFQLEEGTHESVYCTVLYFAIIHTSF